MTTEKAFFIAWNEIKILVCFCDVKKLEKYPEKMNDVLQLIKALFFLKKLLCLQKKISHVGDISDKQITRMWKKESKYQCKNDHRLLAQIKRLR